jgi:hypothetical protein
MYICKKFENSAGISILKGKTICIPKKPKLMFQISQKLNLRFPLS